MPPAPGVEALFGTKRHLIVLERPSSLLFVHWVSQRAWVLLVQKRLFVVLQRISRLLYICWVYLWNRPLFVRKRPFFARPLLSAARRGRGRDGGRYRWVLRAHSSLWQPSALLPVTKALLDPIESE